MHFAQFLLFLFLSTLFSFLENKDFFLGHILNILSPDRISAEDYLNIFLSSHMLKYTFIERIEYYCHRKKFFSPSGIFPTFITLKPGKLPP